MIPWQEIDRAAVPGSDAPLLLMRRGAEYVIRIGPIALMSSAARGSEEALAELACAQVGKRSSARLLVGGLGMGFTLGAALARLPADAEVEVVELVPAVVDWNRGVLAPLAGQPLEDPRVSVTVGDVAARIAAQRAHYDAIVLDVDNGPDGLTRSANDGLYSLTGLRAAHAALRPGGVLGVWSVTGDDAFARRFAQAGFAVNPSFVRARRTKGGRHVVWIGSRR